MSIEQTQAHIKARVWKAIAQSDLDLSGLDKATIESLIDLVSEAALLEIDDSLEEGAGATEVTSAIESDLLADGKEDILWEGRPFLSLSLHYTITDERVRITEGFLGKARENIELIRVQDVDYKQNVGERMFNLGDINIRSHDSSHPNVVLHNIKDPDKVYEILRRAVLHARKKHNFTYREEM